MYHLDTVRVGLETVPGVERCPGLCGEMLVLVLNRPQVLAANKSCSQQRPAEHPPLRKEESWSGTIGVEGEPSQVAHLGEKRGLRALLDPPHYVCSHEAWSRHSSAWLSWFLLGQRA